MILKKKISQLEKQILKYSQTDYTIYFCNEDGFFAVKNDKSDICPWCQNTCEKVDNVEELIAQ